MGTPKVYPTVPGESARDRNLRLKRAWYYRNHEKCVAVDRARTLAGDRREWARNNRAKVNAKIQRWRQTPRGKEKAARDAFVRRFRKHGLTLDQYQAMIRAQDLRCAICGEVPKAIKGHGRAPDGFHIDHHHVSGRVRGLLCGGCNVGIGMLKDSAEVCTKAAAYLTSFRP